MPAHLLRAPVRTLRVLLLAVLAAVLAVPTAGSPAHAADSRTERVLEIAATQHGKPYRYGASGPHAYDCSGFTSWVFRKVGIALPHQSSAQYAMTKHVSQGAKRPGDLIFMHDSGGIYHVGIYAGGNTMWAATKTGDIVRKQTIWSSSYKVGRL